MHEGCSGSFEDGKHVVEKIRMMGFASQPMPTSLNLECKECGETFLMKNFEGKCPKCDMVYGVTPCHAFDPANVQAAGVDY
jgi:rubrerythrin